MLSEEERISELITALDDKNLNTRLNAALELRTMGEKAERAIRAWIEQ